MEIKCKICGTINDGETNFCKGCFVKLDSDKPVESVYNPKENEIAVPIEEEIDVTIPWEEENNDELVDIPNLGVPVSTSTEEDDPWQQPELKPISENNIEKPIEEVVEPVEEIKVEEPIVQPIEESIPESTEEVVESVEEIKVEEPIVQPIEESISESTEEIVDPVEEIKVEEPIVQPVEENIPESTEEVVEPVEEIKVEESIVQPVEENIPESTEEVVDPVEEIKVEESIVQPIEESIPESTEEEVEPVEEIKVEEPIVQPVEENIPESTEEVVDPVEEIIQEVPEVQPSKISNEVVSVLGDNNENQVIENSIPELSEFDEWNKSELPTLDMNQFKIGDEKVNEDEWVDEVDDNEQNEVKYNYIGVGKVFIKYLINCLMFGIVFAAVCIGFRYLMSNIFNMGTRGELIFIVVSSISSVATLLLAADMTLKKSIPLASKINSTSFLILLFIALPYLLIKLAYNLYTGTTLVILLILISLSIIILAIFFNYIRNNMRKKHDLKDDDKVSFIYGILSIIIVIVTLVGVYMYKDKDRDISFDILFNSESNKEMVMQYVYQVEKTILRNQTEKEGYDIPNLTSDVNDAAIDGKMPEEMTLYLNENGGVTSGTIVYKGITYTYDGQTIKAK